MSSRYLPTLSNETTKLVGVAVAASFATFAAVEVYRSSQNKKRRLDLKRQATADVYGPEPSPVIAKASLRPDPEDSEEAARVVDAMEGLYRMPSDAHYDESLIREQLSRNYSFFGEEAMEKVRKGRVVVVGCGGVGSWAAVMLVRSYVPAPSAIT